MTTDVLAVAAHPDDVEFGCGGTLLLAADAGLQVVIVDLTAGELSTRGDPATRERERRRATELLGLTGRECVALPDGRVGCEPEHRDAVAAVIRRLQPRVVLAPRHVAPWVGLAGVFATWEATALLWGNDAAHPTLSLLLDPVLATYPGRIAGWIAWLGVGRWLVIR